MNQEFSVVIERDSSGYFVATVPELRGCHMEAKSLDTRLRSFGPHEVDFVSPEGSGASAGYARSGIDRRHLGQPVRTGAWIALKAVDRYSG